MQTVQRKEKYTYADQSMKIGLKSLSPADYGHEQDTSVSHEAVVSVICQPRGDSPPLSEIVSRVSIALEIVMYVWTTYSTFIMAATHIYVPLPPRDIRDAPPAYRKPTLVSTYSHQPDRSIRHDDSSMTYYRQAPEGVDLKYRFDERTERAEDEDEHLDGICDALQDVANKGGQGERKGGVITWRGMITRIMTAPFEHRDDEKWEMTALALDGSIYVELHDPPEVRTERRNRQSAHAIQSYMGYAYESFSTVTAPGQRQAEDELDGQHESWSGDVNTNVQWCNLVRSAIGDIPLFLGGEVDCVEAEPGSPHPGLEGCVELKTNMLIRNERQQKTFERKLLKHWAQSWLLGVPTVEVGFRDEEGILRTHQKFRTEEIFPMIASLPYPPWNPARSLHFLYRVLSLLVTHVLPSNPTPEGGVSPYDDLPPARVWRFSFIPQKGCELWYVGEVESQDGRWGGVLKDEYVRWRMSHT